MDKKLSFASVCEMYGPVLVKFGGFSPESVDCVPDAQISLVLCTESVFWWMLMCVLLTRAKRRFCSEENEKSSGDKEEQEMKIRSVGKVCAAKLNFESPFSENRSCCTFLEKKSFEFSRYYSDFLVDWNWKFFKIQFLFFFSFS